MISATPYLETLRIAKIPVNNDMYDMWINKSFVGRYISVERETRSLLITDDH